MQRLPIEDCQPIYDLIGFSPTGAEQAAILSNRDRFPCISGGERAGKSKVAAAIMLPHIFLLPIIKPDMFRDFSSKTRPSNPHFLIVGNTYKEPRVEFQYLREWLQELDMLSGGVGHLSTPQDGPWRMVTKDGVVIQTWSLDDPKSIRALHIEGAIIAEAGVCVYDGVERVHGRVSATRGFIVFSGTMERAEQWWVNQLLMGERENPHGFVTYILPTWSNRFEFPGGRNDPEIKRLEALYDEDTFLMRIAAEPRPPRDRVLKAWTHAIVKDIEPPPEAKWYITTDPGYATAHAVLFVAHWTNSEGTPHTYVADEVYEQNLLTRDIIDICRGREWWKRLERRGNIIDVAARAHRDANDSTLEIWERLTPLRFSSQYHREDRSIERLNTSAHAGQLTISPRCQGLLAEAGLGDPVFPEMHPWRYKVDRSGYVVGERPEDAWNHSAKALAYFLLYHVGQVERPRRQRSFNRMKRGVHAAA